MTMNEFEHALDRYGGDLKRWPETERSAAEALIATDAGAARLLAQEGRVDTVLRKLAQETPADAAMVGRMVALIEKNGRHAERPLRPTRRLAALAGAAMAASLVIGFVAGVAVPASDGEDTLAGLMFGASSASVSDSEGVL